MHYCKDYFMRTLLFSGILYQKTNIFKLFYEIIFKHFLNRKILFPSMFYEVLFFPSIFGEIGGGERVNMEGHYFKECFIVVFRSCYEMRGSGESWDNQKELMY